MRRVSGEGCGTTASTSGVARVTRWRMEKPDRGRATACICCRPTPATATAPAVNAAKGGRGDIRPDEPIDQRALAGSRAADDQHQHRTMRAVPEVERAAPGVEPEASDRRPHRSGRCRAQVAPSASSTLLSSSGGRLSNRIAIAVIVTRASGPCEPLAWARGPCWAQSIRRLPPDTSSASSTHFCRIDHGGDKLCGGGARVFGDGRAWCCCWSAARSCASAGGLSPCRRIRLAVYCRIRSSICNSGGTSCTTIRWNFTTNGPDSNLSVPTARPGLSAAGGECAGRIFTIVRLVQVLLDYEHGAWRRELPAPAGFPFAGGGFLCGMIVAVNPL